MKVLHGLGAEWLARLMDAAGPEGPDLSWLLFGPAEPEAAGEDVGDAA